MTTDKKKRKYLFYLTLFFSLMFSLAIYFEWNILVDFIWFTFISSLAMLLYHQK